MPIRYFCAMAKFFLRKKIGDRVVNGHPWIFSNELGDSDGECQPGDIVEVYSYNGSFIGKGYINPSSQIRIRLLTRNKDEEINNEFFYNRIKEAWEYRQQIGYTENCRLIFGEADGLPALIIDKFNDYLVLQTLELVAISGAKNAVPDEIPTDKSNILYYQQSNGVWKGIPVADITRLTPETVELTR